MAVRELVKGDARQAQYIKDGVFEPNPNQTPMTLFEGASEFVIGIT